MPMRVIAASVLVAGCASTATFENVDDALTAGIFLDVGARAALPAGMSLRPVYAKGLGVTKRSEGWRSRLYNDAARYCTIGYGHLIKHAPCSGTEPADLLDGITEAKGEQLLVGDLADAQITVMTAVTTPLSDGQYAALCDFVFNVGSSNFRKSTLLTLVNAGQHELVPSQFRRWILARGTEIPGLRTRREAQIALYFDGQLTPRAAPPAGADMAPIDVRRGE